MKNPDNRLALASGTSIGVYEVKECLSRDPLSLTYRAWNHHLSGAVLLREYFPVELAQRSPDGLNLEVSLEVKANAALFERGLARFLDEGDKLGELQHPALARVLNALEFHDTGYQAISLEQGQTFAEWIESAYSFNSDQLDAILRTLLDGLKAIHEAGLVHGRICPDHLILRVNFDPVLIHFPGGLFDFVTDQDQLEELLAKGYASPQQYLAGHSPTPNDDFYGLGATLFEAYCKQKPEPAPDRQDALQAGKPDLFAQWLTDQNTDRESAVVKVIEWMFHPAAQDRPVSVPQIQEMLEKLNRESEKSRQTSPSIRSWLAGLQTRVAPGGWATAAGIVLMIALATWMWQASVGPDRESVDQQIANTEGIAQEPMQMAQNGTPMQPPVANGQSASRTIASDQGIFEDSKMSAGSSAAAALSQNESLQAPSRETIDQVKVMAAQQEAVPNPDSDPQPLGKSVGSQNDDVSKAVSHQSNDSLSKPIQPAQVPDYLAAAEKHLAAFNLTTPEHDNAYQNFQAVLDVDPNNQQALQGMQKIRDRYSYLIQTAIDKGYLKNAGVYLSRAKSLPGDFPDLAVLQSRLTKAR